MRILYVINGFDPGGAEHGLLTLVENGFFTGHELKVLAFCRGRHHLATRVAEAIGASNLVIASTTTSLSAEACFAGAMALSGQLRHWRPEMVILSLKQANVIGRLVSCFFPSSRCVAYEDISRYRTTMEPVSGYLLRLLSFRVDEIWADCVETMQNATQYFSGRARRRHIVPMFKADHATPHKDDYRLHTPLRLVAAGRLESRKNFHLAIETVRRIRALGTDVHLQIFGDGPEAAPLQRSIDARGLGRYVSLAGYRPDWISQAISRDIFVNLSETEGFCIVVAEAMAAGLPVIATAVGGVREYGLNGKNMLTLKSLDADALVSLIERLTLDQDVRRRLGERAREDMLALHSPAAMRARGQSILSDPSRTRPLKAFS